MEEGMLFFVDSTYLLKIPQIIAIFTELYH